MAWMVHSPWVTVLGLTVCAVGTLLHELLERKVAVVSVWAVLVGSCAAIIALAWGKDSVFTFTSFFAVQAGLVGLALLPATGRGVQSILRKLLSIAWFLIGAVVVVGDGYLNNKVAIFYTGLAAAVAWIFWAKRASRIPMFGVQIFNTFILLIVGLPVVDLLFFPPRDIYKHPNEISRHYSYAVAKNNPEAFWAWTQYFSQQWKRYERVAIIPEPTNNPPFRLRPNSRERMFQCEIPINSLGFRGREIPVEKGNRYRVVVIGESTTFGISLTQDHHPWPELLEEFIGERLKLQRPVEVINAGVPSAILPENLARLRRDILPLKPDMIICYHGYNGFPMLNSAIPSPRGKPPPEYVARPVKLLARVEYAWKLRIYKDKMMARSFFETSLSNPLENIYAAAYRELIDLARTNHLRLVLANFSMAVNQQSDPAVIEFYRQGSPAVQYQIRANQIHSEIVETLCKLEPWICFVDTHPGLDGQYDKFVDLVHFDKNGDRQMAETFFATIKPLIQDDCGTVQ
jgi:lysophospholipase L1-like esterase